MYVCMCMIKIFIGGRDGGKGRGNSERCLKWGGESGRSLTLKPKGVKMTPLRFLLNNQLEKEKKDCSTKF